MTIRRRIQKGLVILLISLVILFSCSTKSEELEFSLREIVFDYHYVNSQDLMRADKIYSPENLILIFDAFNNSKVPIDIDFYSKANRSDSLSAFHFIIKNDTLILRSVRNRIVIEPHKKTMILTEFPYESFELIKRPLKAVINQEKFNDESQVSIIFKESLISNQHFPVRVDSIKGNVRCYDTSFAVPVSRKWFNEND